MRTTLTLDDDVAALLHRAQQERKETLKEVVNSALREGLVRMTNAAEPRVPFRTRTLSLGECLLPNLDNVEEILAIAEGENHK